MLNVIFTIYELSDIIIQKHHPNQPNDVLMVRKYADSMSVVIWYSIQLRW